ncbi:MAG: FKBP-type peptidyl-prolyl cis-trans isomerase [Muribaculaceae bacterium]|nr:FKBP-type peptidyl-prolyl cis-trans isomerase [Muribaculaceae bacterium]
MKKLFYFALILGVAGAISACSGKDKAQGAENAVESQEEVVEEVVTDSVSARFRNPDYKADVATDSTYAVTPSGLKYMVLKEGTGKSPAATDNVTVHYTGKLLDGTVFDSSVQRGEPATFSLNGVIAGWTEGLQLMKEGAKYVFYIPTDLAYGPRGGGPIPPYSDLVFEVELIKVGE